MIFTRLTDKILIFTNPLTYLCFIIVFTYIPIEWIIRKLQFHNLYFIFFQIDSHNKEGLERVIEAAKRNFKISKNRWYKYIFKLAIVKCRLKIKQIDNNKHAAQHK